MSMLISKEREPPLRQISLMSIYACFSLLSATLSLYLYYIKTSLSQMRVYKRVLYVEEMRHSQPQTLSFRQKTASIVGLHITYIIFTSYTRAIYRAASPSLPLCASPRASLSPSLLSASLSYKRETVIHLLRRVSSLYLEYMLFLHTQLTFPPLLLRYSPLLGVCFPI